MGRKIDDGNRKHKTLKIVLAAILTPALAIGFAVWVMFGDIITAANSIVKLEDGLYVMEFKGDYGFDDFLKEGGAASDAEVGDYLIRFLSKGFYKGEEKIETGDSGCSAICVESETGGYLYGRNYDWKECSAIIMHTKPDDGYESFSTGCIDFLGFGDAYAPDASIMERIQAIAAIYVPLDGMNEEGLMIADLMAGDDEDTHQNTGKCNLTTTTAIRLLLDHAATVDEAVALLQQYDMNSSMGTAHHLAIMDKSGKSVAVEYIDGEMIVTDTKVLTNHYLAQGEKQGIGSEQSHLRFDSLSAYVGSTNQNGVKQLLESVAQKSYPQSEGSYEKTMWSIVYTPEGLCADFYFSENYESGYGIMLRDKSGFVFERQE